MMVLLSINHQINMNNKKNYENSEEECIKLLFILPRTFMCLAFSEFRFKNKKIYCDSSLIFLSIGFIFFLLTREFLSKSPINLGQRWENVQLAWPSSRPLGPDRDRLLGLGEPQHANPWACFLFYFFNYYIQLRGLYFSPSLEPFSLSTFFLILSHSLRRSRLHVHNNSPIVVRSVTFESHNCFISIIQFQAIHLFVCAIRNNKIIILSIVRFNDLYAFVQMSGLKYLT